LTNFGLQRELEERSKQDLAVAAIYYDTISVRFFDGRKTEVKVACCKVSGAGVIARNRIVLVDLPVDHPRAAMLGFFGGPVVVMDTHGAIVQRSDLEVDAHAVSLSPDEKTIAFVGAPRGPLGDLGVFVAGFHGLTARKVKDLPVQTGPPLPDLDWSPDGQNLLLSNLGAIEILNVETGQSQKVADGRDARWSPSGDWISYVNPQSRAALLNLRTHETKIIDPSAKIAWQIEWSPDGKLLLFAEQVGTYFGLQWVYRISDGAYCPVHDLGGVLRPNWITLN
jgi:WD40 repeat protein